MIIYERLDARHIFKKYGLQPKSFSENGPAEGWRGGGAQGAQDCSQFEVIYHNEFTVKYVYRDDNLFCFRLTWSIFRNLAEAEDSESDLEDPIVNSMVAAFRYISYEYQEYHDFCPPSINTSTLI